MSVLVTRVYKAADMLCKPLYFGRKAIPGAKKCNWANFIWAALLIYGKMYFVKNISFMYNSID
jgi:hypothetical protein